MTQETKHTPTPITPAQVNGQDYWRVPLPSGMVAFVKYEEDAIAVQRACNAHDELVKAAICAKALDMKGDEGWAILAEHGFEIHNRFDYPATRFVADIIDAALAKARGEA